MRSALPILLVILLVLTSVSVNIVLAQNYLDDLPWGVERVRGDLPWDSDRNLIVDPGANAGQGIRVAVIDSGIWKDHPDLAGRVVGGYSFVAGKEYWEDSYGHGTHIAGTIAAIDNGNHLIGIAPKVSLYAVKVYDDPELINPTYIASGIRWAVDQSGAHIISISLGSYHNYPEVEEAVNYANANGVLLIATAGDDNLGEVKYPAKYDSVIAVGAIDREDKRWVNPPYGSNYGPEMELSAPGMNINSTVTPSGYELRSGTSFAVPHVTGTAALIWGSKMDPAFDSNGNGQWDYSEVRAKLQKTALDLPPSGRDAEYGFGLVNAWRSLQRPEGDITRDGKVNILDLAAVGRSYGKDDNHPDWWLYHRPHDININNVVYIEDLTIVGRNYGKVDP